MIREKAPTILTAEGARRLVSKARNALAVADDVLAQLYAGEAWVALGHADWAAFCAAELPELRHIKLRKPERQARVRLLHEQGASRREIAAATGADVATIQRDVVAIEGRSPVANATPTSESRADQIVRLVAAQGPRGATSPEIVRLARCSQGAASGALSRLHAQGRVRVTREHRNGFGIYVAGL
jgi:hypothetical protein